MKFECKKCGQCCNKFDDDSGGIMIFEWEKKKLEQIARQNKINFKIEPGQTDYDRKSNTKIISTFAFKSKSCPFLKNKKCSIHPQRPLYCRAYPLLVTITKNKFNLSLLACPNAKLPNLCNPEKLDWTSNDHFLINYYKTFGDIFLQALELEIFRHNYLEIMTNLKKNKLVDIQKLKQSDSPETNTFFEFLIKNKFLLQKDADKIIQDILNFSNAKAMIGLNENSI